MSDPRQRAKPLLLLLGLGLASLGLHAAARAAAGDTGSLVVGPTGAWLTRAPAALPTAPLPPETDPIDLAGQRMMQGNRMPGS